MEHDESEEPTLEAQGDAGNGNEVETFVKQSAFQLLDSYEDEDDDDDNDKQCRRESQADR
jgi:hypothetical protein